jgi:hypothetical protein
MGTVITSLGDLGYQHEGYVAHVLDDGTLTGSYSRDIDAHKTGKLQADCECEWTGSRQWDNDNEDPGGWPSDELESEILADWEAHVRGLGVAEERQDLQALARVLRGFGRNADDLEAAVRGNLPDESSADVLKRISGNLTYAAEIIGRMTREDA